MIRHVFLLTLLFGLSVSHSAKSFAQEAPDTLILVTSPASVNLSTEPGKSVSTDIRLRNGGNSKETINVGLLKFTSSDEGRPILKEREAGDSFFDWVKFSETSFEILPNEWKTIKVDFTVPEDAAFSYFYAVTFSRSSEVTSGGNQSLVGATSSLVLLEVRVPNAVRKVEPKSFTSNRSFYEFLPVDLNIVLRNTGNVHLAPRGNIFIEDRSGKQVAVLEVNAEKGNILPQSSRSFSASWNDGFPVYEDKTEDGKIVNKSSGEPQKVLKWDFRDAHKLRMGKYTAHLLLVFDDGERDIPIESSLSFWVIPVRIIAGSLVLIGLALFGLMGIVRSGARKIIRK